MPSQSVDFNVFQYVKENNDIVKVVESVLPLRRQGKMYVGLCPWHDDTKPSLQVNPERQTYRCWVCDIGGDVINFILRTENHANNFEAVLSLANRSGLDISGFLKNQDSEKYKRLKTLENVLEQATSFYEAQLLNDRGARDYVLNERKINEESRQKFRLGYHDYNSVRELRDHFRDKFSDQELIEAGLLGQSDEGRVYERFKGRLIFPITDSRGKIIGFAGRIVPWHPRYPKSTDSEEVKQSAPPKYINSPQTFCYRKSEILYGLSHAKKSILDSGEVIVVEGYSDVIQGHQNGLENFVSTGGTAFSDDHVKMLRILNDPKIILTFDGDDAGISAANRTCPKLLGRVRARICYIPEGLDPDDVLKKPEGKKRLTEVLADDKTYPVFEVYLQGKTMGLELADPVNQHKLLASVASDFLNLPLGVLSLYIENLSRKTSLSKETIESYLFDQSGFRILSKGKKHEFETQFVRSLVCQPNLIPIVQGRVPLQSLKSPECRAVYEYLIKQDKPIETATRPLFSQNLDIILERILAGYSGDRERIDINRLRRLVQYSGPRHGPQSRISMEVLSLHLLCQDLSSRFHDSMLEDGRSFSDLAFLLGNVSDSLKKTEVVSGLKIPDGYVKSSLDFGDFYVIEKSLEKMKKSATESGLPEFRLYLEQLPRGIDSCLNSDNARRLTKGHNLTNKFLVFDLEKSSEKKDPIISIGVLTYDSGRFYSQVYFARDPNEEKAIISELLAKIPDYSTIITYNGTSFDVPRFLERLQYNGFSCRSNCEGLLSERHVDLYPIVKRNLGLLFPDRTLRTLEKEYLSYDRGNDLNSRYIPEVYQKFLIDNDTSQMIKVLNHNLIDVWAIAGIMKNLFEGKK